MIILSCGFSKNFKIEMIKLTLGDLEIKSPSFETIGIFLEERKLAIISISL